MYCDALVLIFILFILLSFPQVLGNFLAEEQRKTVTQGRAALINPPPLASFPQPLVTWYKDGHKIIPNNRM